MNRIYHISKWYEYDLSVVDSILYKSSTSDSLVAEIRQNFLFPGNADIIKAFVGESEKVRQDVATYILNNIVRPLTEDS